MTSALRLPQRSLSSTQPTVPTRTPSLRNNAHVPGWKRCARILFVTTYIIGRHALRATAEGCSPPDRQPQIRVGAVAVQRRRGSIQHSISEGRSFTSDRPGVVPTARVSPSDRTNNDDTFARGAKTIIVADLSGASLTVLSPGESLCEQRTG